MIKENSWICCRSEGAAWAVECSETLVDVQSEYQHIQIFDSPRLGRILMLDNIVQLTEFDEFAYQEMMSHPALFVHSDPKRVLIIGGGDGGVAREVLRHPCVESVDLCEIDPMVVELCKKYLPNLASSFDNSRVHLHIGDGAAFIKEHKNEYDVIIVDSTDPGGLAEPLFSEEFYHSACEALTEKGVMIAQSESVFLFPEVVQRLVGYLRKFFPHTGYGIIAVPTYPTGCIGCCIGSKCNPVNIPCRKVSPEIAEQLRYYTPQIHTGAFMLPAFAERIIRSVSK